MGVIIGTSAQVAKRNCIRLVEEKWGAGWFEEIPGDMRDPTWVGPEGCTYARRLRRSVCHCALCIRGRIRYVRH